ncbi:MAG TPA: hypothetical protein VEM40_02535 [Nitrospirota bacterium]|nr:hypothetical protein [Nitrospirota bacterium]
MRIVRPSLSVLLVLFFSSVASAVEFSGQSNSYLFSRETSDSTRQLPFYEYLNFKAEDLGSPSISIHFGGWYRYDFQDETFGVKSSSDLQYAYLSLKRDTGNTFLNLGRLYVNEGTSSEIIDGAYGRTDFMGGFTVAAFGGHPVSPQGTIVNATGGGPVPPGSATRSDGSLYGGRISQGIYGLYRVGFTYLLEKNSGTDFRKEEGLDLWLRPVDKVELAGTSLYNAITSDWAQHNYCLTLGPFSIVTFRTIYTYVSYKDYFTAATTTAFKLDPAIINPQETVSSIGEEVSFSLGKAILSADYKRYSYDIAGDASYYGGRITYAGAHNVAAGLSVHRMDGQTDTLKYDEYRLYGSKKFDTIDIAIDLLTVSYDVEINGVKNAYSASLAGGYALSAKARLAADVEYEKDPFYNRNVTGLLKFVYNFDVRTGAKGGNNQ